MAEPPAFGQGRIKTCEYAGLDPLNSEVYAQMHQTKRQKLRTPVQKLIELLAGHRARIPAIHTPARHLPSLPHHLSSLPFPLLPFQLSIGVVFVEPAPPFPLRPLTIKAPARCPSLLLHPFEIHRYTVCTAPSLFSTQPMSRTVRAIMTSSSPHRCSRQPQRPPPCG